MGVPGQVLHGTSWRKPHAWNADVKCRTGSRRSSSKRTRESRKKRHDKREKRDRGDRGSGAGGSAPRGGGGDPRDAEVRASRNQLPEALAANADSSSPSDSEHSECTATTAQMAKMRIEGGILAARVDCLAHPARGGEERAQWRKAVAGDDPGRGKTAQNAPESSGGLDAKHDQLQLSL